mmetsp:Transcript_11271/g.30106  ORF Transcript_11271/g.30106 Transcript_11271/m.30106 type:complete len:251 (-) Transcript_11271:168-920(-)
MEEAVADSPPPSSSLLASCPPAIGPQRDRLWPSWSSPPQTPSRTAPPGRATLMPPARLLPLLRLGRPARRAPPLHSQGKHGEVRQPKTPAARNLHPPSVRCTLASISSRRRATSRPLSRASAPEAACPLQQSFGPVLWGRSPACLSAPPWAGSPLSASGRSRRRPRDNYQELAPESVRQQGESPEPLHCRAQAAPTAALPSEGTAAASISVPQLGASHHRRALRRCPVVAAVSPSPPEASLRRRIPQRGA